MAVDESPDLTLDIDESGTVRGASRAVLRRLAAQSGRYRLLPGVGDLILLQRLDDQPKTAPGAGLALAGEIDGPGALANVLNFVHFSQWDGALTVLAGATRKTVFFKRGAVLAASSNLPEDRIGALLVRFGHVSDEVLTSCLRDVTPQRRLGAVLVERGVLSAADLYEVVRRQVEEIFYSSLLFLRGAFFFTKRLEEKLLPMRLHLDTQGLLLEGLRRIDEMSYFRAKIPSGDCVLVARRAVAGSEPAPSPGAATLLRLVDGVKALSTLAREARLGEFAATKAAFELVQTGLAEVRERGDLSRPFVVGNGERSDEAAGAIIDAYNGALARLYGTISSKGQGASLRGGVRAFGSGSNRYAALFQGATLGDDGTLPRLTLVDNLSRLPEKDPLGALQRGLSELLFFALFLAGDSLSQAEEQELHERVAKALSALPGARPEPR